MSVALTVSLYFQKAVSDFFSIHSLIFSPKRPMNLNLVCFVFVPGIMMGHKIQAATNQ